ncbi:hypothetical protein [Mycoplasma sp. VS31B]
MEEQIDANEEKSKSEKADLLKQVEDKKAELANLQKEYQEKNAELDGTNAKNAELTNKVQEFEKQLSAIKGEKDTLTQQLANKTEEFKNLQKELEAKDAELQSTIKQKNDLSKQVEELQAQLTAAQKEKETLKATFDDVNKKYEKLLIENSELKSNDGTDESTLQDVEKADGIEEIASKVNSTEGDSLDDKIAKYIADNNLTQTSEKEVNGKKQSVVENTEAGDKIEISILLEIKKLNEANENDDQTTKNKKAKLDAAHINLNKYQGDENSAVTLADWIKFAVEISNALK